MSNRGAKPGERRGGRTTGSPNKATVEIKDIARKYGPAIMEEAVKLAGVIDGGSGKAESEQARLAAMTLVMGYGYGKPSQVIGSDPNNPLPSAIEHVQYTIIDPRDAPKS